MLECTTKAFRDTFLIFLMKPRLAPWPVFFLQYLCKPWTWSGKNRRDKTRRNAAQAQLHLMTDFQTNNIFIDLSSSLHQSTEFVLWVAQNSIHEKTIQSPCREELILIFLLFLFCQYFVLIFGIVSVACRGDRFGRKFWEVISDEHGGARERRPRERQNHCSRGNLILSFMSCQKRQIQHVRYDDNLKLSVPFQTFGNGKNGFTIIILNQTELKKNIFVFIFSLSFYLDDDPLKNLFASLLTFSFMKRLFFIYDLFI